MSDEEWSKLSFENSELRSEVDRLNAEAAWLKTQMAGLVEYEGELSAEVERLAALVQSEVERLKGVLGPVLEIAERNEPGGATWAARKALEGEI